MNILTFAEKKKNDSVDIMLFNLFCFSHLAPSIIVNVCWAFIHIEENSYVETDLFYTLILYNKLQRINIVLLKKDAPRNQWPLRKIIEINPDDQGIVRSVTLLLGIDDIAIVNEYWNVQSQNWY